MTKLYITHPEFNFNSINKNSKLLDNVNARLTNSEYHTSLGDLDINELLAIIHKFDSIEFVKNNFIQGEYITTDTLQFLSFAQSKIKVDNVSSTNPLSFADHPDIKNRVSDKMLWVYGCSYSHGTGLSDSSATYGNHLSKYLNLPLKLISKPGSSTHWSLRQLINSELKKDDEVIWQITSPYRLSSFNGKHTEEILLSNCNNRTLIEAYPDEQCFFLQLSYLNIGVQYLRNLGVKFTVIAVDSQSLNFNHEYSKYPEYYYATNFTVDVAPDGLHFGPLSHKKLALSLLSRVQLQNV